MVIQSNRLELLNKSKSQSKMENATTYNSLVNLPTDCREKNIYIFIYNSNRNSETSTERTFQT